MFFKQNLIERLREDDDFVVPAPLDYVIIRPKTVNGCQVQQEIKKKKDDKKKSKDKAYNLKFYNAFKFLDGPEKGLNRKKQYKQF